MGFTQVCVIQVGVLYQHRPLDGEFLRTPYNLVHVSDHDIARFSIHVYIHTHNNIDIHVYRPTIWTSIFTGLDIYSKCG